MTQELEGHTSDSFPDTLGIKTQYDYIRIHINKIAYCKADGSYSEIYLDDGSKIVISKSLHALEERLKEFHFIRCHYSYLVNIRKVDRFVRQSKTLEINNHKIPVSRRRCGQIMMSLKSLKNHF